jgi:hypothetical protein
MSELGSITKLTGANFSAHRIASVAPTTFAQVFGVSAPASKPPIAGQIGQYIPLKSDVFTRSNNNVRFSGQSVQAQFAEFARSARLARFSGLGVTKKTASFDGHHALLYQFASAHSKPNETHSMMAALRVTHPAFGNGPITADVVTYRHAPQLNSKLTLHNNALQALPRLDFGAAVPTTPNLVRFGDGTVVPASAASVAIVLPNPIVSNWVNLAKSWFASLPAKAQRWLDSNKSALPLPAALGDAMLPLVGGTTATRFGSTKPERVDLVTAMKFGNNVVEIVDSQAKGPTATRQNFASLKEASVGISEMANQLQGFTRLADQTVSNFANASKAVVGVASPYAKSPFASNPFASVAFAGGSKPPPGKPVEATAT